MPPASFRPPQGTQPEAAGGFEEHHALGGVQTITDELGNQLRPPVKSSRLRASRA